MDGCMDSRDIQTYTYIQRYRWGRVMVSVYTCVSSLCSLNEPKRTDIPVAMSTPRAQILASQHHSPVKGARVVTNSRARAGKILDEPGTTCSAKHEEVRRTERGLSEQRNTSLTPTSGSP